MGGRRWALALVGLGFGFGCGGGGGDGTTTPFDPPPGSGSANTDATSSDTQTDGPTSGATATSTPTTTATDSASGADSTGDETTGSVDDSGGVGLDPPAGGSSGGAGGAAANGEQRTTDTGVTYFVIAPADAGPLPAMIVYSGTEGGGTMTQNLLGAAGATGNTGTVFAVLDGVTYNGNGQAGADVLDDVRADYDIDNDRTYLLSESAGTSAGLQLGLQLRQSYFAAYWANDVNTSETPLLTSAELGFEPFGNAGPGGDFADADAIVAGMVAAGYRTPPPAPYDGPGAGSHGDPQQFIAALSWFPGKTRQ